MVASDDKKLSMPPPPKDTSAAATDPIATPRQIDDDDVYVDIDDTKVTPSKSTRVPSYRSLHRTSSRQTLSRLESFIHPEHSKALLPTTVLYVSVIISLIGSFQTGWLLTQLNFLPFNKGCDAVEIAPETCIMFPGHSKNEWTMTIVAWVVGAAIGAGLSGIPADKIGRKRTMFFNAFVMIVGAAVQATAQSIYLLALGRFISGLATGTAINVSNVFISEISPLQLRGMLSTGLQVGVAVGSLCVTSTHYIIGTGHYGWRIMVGTPMLFGLVQILLMPVMSQSPVWLVGQGRIEEAGAAMRRLYLPTDYDEILHAVVQSHEEEQREMAVVKPWAALFSRKYALQLLIAIVICSAQQLSGINAVMYYSATIFNQTGISDPRVANTILNVIRTCSIFVAARLIDRFPRRTLLSIGMSVMAIASGVLVYSLVNSVPALAVAAVGVFVAAWGLSIGPMCWMVGAELFPDFLHANAGSVGVMCTWFFNTLVTIFYPILAQSNNLGNYAFCIFSGCLIAIVLFVIFVVPETGHKTYVEIAQAFGIEEVDHAETSQEFPDRVSTSDRTPRDV
ncbi:unnamed protein product [Aphanomyces euteiches]|nr:hypothetical protein AeRB84_009844 [Aphanomyces euteiches]